MRRARPVNQYVDGFGNPTHLITVRGSHNYLEVVARSRVETLLVHPFALPETRPRPLACAERADHLAPSALVPSNTDLDFLAAPLEPSAPEGIFDAVHALMQLVYQEFD